MKALKIVFGLVLLLVIVVVIGVFIVGSNLNSLVKLAVEEAGSNALKTTVSLESADVDLMAGRVHLSGLSVANPSGFNQAEAFLMNDIVVDVELESLKNSVVDVTEVSVDGLRVAAEQKGTTTNIQTLLNNLESDAGTEDSQPADDSSAQTDILVKVGQINFTDGSVYLSSDRLGDSDLSLPTIKLNDIGGSAGVPPDQLAEQIAQPLLKQITAAVEQSVKSLLKDKAKEKLGEKEDELKQKLDEKLGEKLGTDRESLKSLLGR